LLFLPGAALAQIGDEVPHDRVEDVAYGKWKDRDVTFDVLTPRSPKHDVGILLIASGGWKSKKHNYEEGLSGWAGELLKGGYTVFVVYHPNFDEGAFVPDMVAYVDRAVRFIRLNAKKYKVNPNALGLTSGSSGGHLALMVGLRGDDGETNSDDPVMRVSNRVQAIVAWYPPTDFLNWSKPGSWKNGKGPPKKTAEEVMGAKGEELDRVLKQMSPITYVSPDDPPVLLLHAMGDFTVPIYQSYVLEAALEKAGVPNLLIVHRGFGHNRGKAMFDEYDPVRAWFRKYLIRKHP